MKQTLRLAADVRTVKNLRNRKVVGFLASLGDLRAQRNTKKEALDAIAKLIGVRCNFENTQVKVVPFRGHVGVFSFDLEGRVCTQHVWPDSHVSLVAGAYCVEEAEASFKYHVAQHKWTGTAKETPEGLTEDQQREFASWVRFQLAYRDATARGMDSIQAHAYACEHS